MERSPRRRNTECFEDLPDESFPVVHPGRSLEEHRIEIGKLGDGPGKLAPDAAVVAELEKVLGLVPGTSKLLCLLKGGSFLCIHHTVISWRDEKDELFMLLPPSRIAIKSSLIRKMKNTGETIIYSPCMAAVEFLGLNEEERARFPPAGHMELASFIRNRGNQKFSRGDYVLASLFYKEAAAAAEENHQPNELLLAISNHAQCMLKLQRFEEAIASCNKALSIDPRHAKSFFRRAQALSHLQSHTEALASLRSSLELSEENSKAPVLEAIKRSSTLAHQQQTGAYETLEFFLGGFDERLAPECGDFISNSIEIRNTGDEKGRGIFLTRKVKAGDLLMVSNPVASGRSNYSLLVDAVRTCCRSGRARRIFNSLSDSNSLPALENFGPWSSEAEDDGVIDLRGVHRVLELTSKRFKVSGAEKKMVFGLPGLINHSCLPNSTAIMVGGALFIRAAKNLSTGEEITITYVESLTPLEFRSRSFHHWGFDCRCERCEVEKRFSRALSAIPEPVMSFGGYEEMLRSKVLEFVAVEEALEKIGSEASEEEKNMIRAGYIEDYVMVAGNKREGVYELAWEKFEPIPSTRLLKLMHELVPGNIKSIVLIARIEFRLMMGQQSSGSVSGSDSGHFRAFRDAIAGMVGDRWLPPEAYMRLCSFLNSDANFFKTFLLDNLDSLPAAAGL